MIWTIVGLGNPDAQYSGTRHNVGKELVGALASKLPKGTKVVELNVYMNNSGPAIKKVIKSKKDAAHLVVVHDELDLPLGKAKVSVGNSAGGHNGIKSIIKALGTQDFVRVRVGISPSTASGKLKRPTGEDLAPFVLGKFKPGEKDKLKKSKKLVAEAIELIVGDSVERAQTEINSQ